jgi:hypothetical protein
MNNRETKRQSEIQDLCSKGVIPHEHELEQHPEKSVAGRAWLIGSVAAQIHEVLPAKTIVENMVKEAAQQMRRFGTGDVKAKL